MNKNQEIERRLEALNEQFQMSEGIRSRLDETYKELAKDQNNKTYNAFILKCGSIFLAFILGVGVIGTLNPLLAKEIPVLYRLFEGLHQTIFKDTPYEKYAEPKHLKAIDNGIEIIIEEVFCDQRMFGYTYTIKSEEEKLRENKEIYDRIRTSESIAIDGKPFQFTGRYGNGEFIDEYTYTGSNMYTADMLLPEQFELEIIIHEFETSLTDTFTESGKWQFKTLVTKHTTPYSRVVQPDSELKVIKPIPFSLDVEEVGFTPLNTYITLQAKRDGEIDYVLNEYEVNFVIIDNLGQTYIPGNGGSRLTEDDIYEWQLNFTVPKQMPEWIAIIPSVIPLSEGGWIPKERVTQTQYKGELPVVVTREGLGDYVISEIREIGDDLVIRAKLEEIQPHQWLTLRLKDGSEKRGETILEEDGWIERRYEDCKADSIDYFELEDSGQKYDLEQMVKITINIPK